VRIHHLNCGSLCPLGGRLLGGVGGLLSPAPMCCHCLLIEGDDRLILVDTGLGVEDVNEPRRLGPLFNIMMRPRLEVAETALRQVVDLGYRPSDVRHIVPTHLDLDHAGGISDFPGAAVHIFADELRAASSRPSLIERSRYRGVQISAVKKWAVVKEEGESWFGFSAVRAIPGTKDEFSWSRCRVTRAAIVAWRFGGLRIGSSIAATPISTIPRSSRAAAQRRRVCERSKGW
jgi:glyoxylase-like metal-dependent hydrolase (beta-lactamase superfamily II)